jgi:hypothetical protein
LLWRGLPKYYRYVCKHPNTSSQQCGNMSIILDSIRKNEYSIWSFQLFSMVEKFNNKNWVKSILKLHCVVIFILGIHSGFSLYKKNIINCIFQWFYSMKGRWQKGGKNTEPCTEYMCLKFWFEYRKQKESDKVVFKHCVRSTFCHKLLGFMYHSFQHKQVTWSL